MLAAATAAGYLALLASMLPVATVATPASNPSFFNSARQGPLRYYEPIVHASFEMLEKRSSKTSHSSKLSHRQFEDPFATLAMPPAFEEVLQDDVVSSPSHKHPDFRGQQPFLLTFEAFNHTFALEMRPDEHLLKPDTTINVYSGPGATTLTKYPITQRPYTGNVVQAPGRSFADKRDSVSRTGRVNLLFGRDQYVGSLGCPCRCGLSFEHANNMILPFTVLQIRLQDETAWQRYCFHDSRVSRCFQGGG
jgi:hypothetical protein